VKAEARGAFKDGGGMRGAWQLQQRVEPVKSLKAVK